MNHDEPEYLRQDASTRAAMKHALDLLAKAAEKEHPGSDEEIPPLPEDLRDQWLRELTRQQATANPVRKERSVSVWQHLIEWWHTPKFWISGLATAAVVMMAVLLIQPKDHGERITRGGEREAAETLMRSAVIADPATYEKFRSLRSGEAPQRYATREQAIADAGTSPMLLIDFQTKKILVYREGHLHQNIDFPSEDLLDLSIAIDRILKP